MSKVKLFVENFLIYGLGGIISKLVPLIMVPVVTWILPTTDYFGISDLSNTIVNLSSALAVMGMYDAMYRMFFEKEDEEYKKKICSTTLAFTIVTSIVVFCIMFILRKWISQCFFGGKEYSYVVLISAVATLVGGTNSIICAPTRMQNKRGVFLITNTVGPIISYGIAIPMLLAGHYVIALPLAAVISAGLLEISFWGMNRRWFDLKDFDRSLLRQLLKIAIPLFPNFLIYWCFNSCDKVMITNILGLGESGIYSVGSKFGNCSQLIYLAFAGGWQYFAFATMNDDNQVESNSKVFEYLGIISFVATSFVCAVAYEIFNILFSKVYLEGYIVAPYLFLAPLLQMLFQVIANQFLVIKKTWPNLLILSFGAILNILINYFLIPVWGIEGAALATLAGYIVSDIVCVIVLCKMKLMVITRKFIIATVLMMVYMVCWRFLFSAKIFIGIGGAFLLSLIYILLYKEELLRMIESIKPKLKSIVKKWRKE